MFQFSSSKPVNDVTGTNGQKSKPGPTKAEKRQITRNRTSYSCVTCRRRKVKCDKIRPICGGCEKANEHCMYNDDVPTTAVEASQTQEDNGPSWKKRKSSLVGVNSTDGLASSALGFDDPIPSTDLKAIEEQLQRLTSMVDALRNGNTGGDNLRLKEMFTPEPSNSESGSDAVQPRPSMGLDMFQPSNHGSSREPADLSTPLSSLKLSSGEARGEDPFWNHISDELDQLNHLMRRRDNTYATSLRPENKQCDVPREETPPALQAHGLEKDDSCEPNDFHKEAGLQIPESLDVDSGNSFTQLMPFGKSSLLQGLPLKCSAAAAVRHTIQVLPTRVQSNVLFRSWLSGVYPLIGIFLPSEISKKHEDFWNRIEASGIPEADHCDPELLAALNSIWYAGSLSISLKGLRQWFPNTSRASLCTRFHDQTVFCLLLGSFRQDVTLHRLAALVLLQSMPIAEEDPTQSSLYLALIVRLAFNMGLHREPTLFELSVEEENMRRRLWWQIIQLDISNVVASGYPSQISEKFCDTRVICEDRDSFTSEAAGSVSSDSSAKSVSPQSSSTSGETATLSPFRTLALLARGKSIMACALRSIVSIHLETKKLRNEDLNEMKRIMTEAEVHINDIINAIPTKGLPEMGFSPEGSRGPTHRDSDSDVHMGTAMSANDVAFYRTTQGNIDSSWSLTNFYRQKQMAYNKWARISLAMLTDKMHCVAYAPFLKNTKSKLWNVGRQCALRNCHSFLRRFASLATDPDLQPFRWAWPAMYGPLHAVLIVLVDLYERPASVEAPRSRELVDMVFAMAAPRTGIVGGADGVTVQRPLREGGIGAWDMLHGLRSAAWQKAGLDPTVLWTEEDQLKVGLATPLTETQRIAQSLREDTVHSTSTFCSDGARASGNGEMEQGIQYMVKLAYADFSNDTKSADEMLSETRKTQYLFGQGSDRDARSNGGRGLVRREGQATMPFPLTRHMEKCSGHVAAVNARPDHVFDMHTHVPRPGGAVRSCGGEALKLVNEAEAKLSQSTSEDPAMPAHRGWGHTAVGDIISAESAMDLKQAGGMVNGGGPVNGYGSDIPSYQGEGLHGSQNPASNGLHQGDTDTDMDLGFDWERWDSVFGQYSGFADLMDDVDAWTEYVTT